MENVLTSGIYWAGVHIPEPAPGAALNSWVIKDEKCAVIDSGAPATASAVVAKVREIVDPARIDYIILTHADVDHAGGLRELVAAAPQATVVASAFEARYVALWGVQSKVQVVNDGDTLSLGRRTLRFLSTPFVCTPGHTLVFDETDGIVFSGDLFALVGPQEWRIFAEAEQMVDTLRMVQDYKLGNSEYVRQALGRLKELPVKIVASGHGQALRGDIAGAAQALRG